MGEQLGSRRSAGGKELTSLFRSGILLLFIGGLAAFFFINPARWLPSQVLEPLVVRVNATPDLQASVRGCPAPVLSEQPPSAWTPLSLSIDYEEDAVAGKGIVERWRQNGTPASALSPHGIWLTSRTAVQLLEITHRTQVSDRALHPLASTMLTVLMWESRARDVLPAAMAAPSRSQPLSWNDVDISWMAWHNLTIKPAAGSLSPQAPVRWAIPHPPTLCRRPRQPYAHEPR